MKLFYMGRHEAESTNKGQRRAGTILPVALAFVMLIGTIAYADVFTDKWDYDYGETVQISGDGMSADEEVRVDVLYPDGSLAQSTIVTASEAGDFADAFYLADGMPAGIYDVIATGLVSGAIFQTQFDPAHVVFDSTPIVAPTTVSPGEVFTVTGRFRGDVNGGSGKSANATLTFGGGFVVSAPATQIVTVNNANTLVTATWTVTAPASGSGTGTLLLDNPSTSPDFSATFVVTVVNPDSSAPVITPTVTGTMGANGWYTSDVTLTWSVVENESPATLVKTGCVDQSITTDQAPANYLCSATSSGGSSGPVTVTIKRDATAPAVTATPAPGANASGWNNTDVLVSFSGVDTHSGIDVCDTAVNLTSEGADQSSTGSCTDKAGNTGSATATGINIDKTAPSVSTLASPMANLAGWNNTNVVVSFLGSDALSGVAFCTDADILTSEGADQSSTGSCTDKAGNTDSATATGINIDKTAPVVSATPLPAANAFGWNNSDVMVSFSGSDALSGLVGCDDPETLSGEGSGQSSTGSCTDVAGNTGSATASGINIDKTAPVVSATPLPAANAFGWNNTDVMVSFSGSDALSGLVGCDDPETLSGEGSGQSSTGSCIDVAGNTGSATASGINIDKTAPVVSATPLPAANAFGWNNTDVTVWFTAVDPLSGVDSCDAADTLTGEGASQSSLVGSCVDKAGNTASAQATGINIDKTAPTASASASPTANAFGWNNTNVTVTFSAVDGLSGLDTCDSADILFTEGTGQSSTGFCRDKAGNSASATVSGINIDKTAPTLAPTVSPNPVLLGGSASATANAADSLSGVASQACDPVDTSTVGSHSVSCTAADLAGNSDSGLGSYNVNYDFAGFFKPIDMGAWNRVKAGSAIPTKFSLGGNQGLGIFAPGYPKATTVSCMTMVETSAVEETVTAGGSSLSYDAGADQYIYVWKTDKSWGNTCRRLDVKFIDGTVHSAIFTFTK